MPWVGGLALWETFNGVPETGAGEEIIPSNNSGFCSGCFKLLGRSCFEIAACYVSLAVGSSRSPPGAGFGAFKVVAIADAREDLNGPDHSAVA